MSTHEIESLEVALPRLEAQHRRGKILHALMDSRMSLWEVIEMAQSDKAVARLSIRRVLQSAYGRYRADKVMERLREIFPEIDQARTDATVKKKKVAKLSWLWDNTAAAKRLLGLAVALTEPKLQSPWPAWPWAEPPKDAKEIYTRWKGA